MLYKPQSRQETKKIRTMMEIPAHTAATLLSLRKGGKVRIVGVGPKV